MKDSLRFRAIFISDVHLGSRDVQAEFLLDFLRHTESDYLYLVGDIIDLWKLKNGWHWPRVNNEIVRAVLNKARQGTKVIYIPGNHDEMLREYCGTTLKGIRLRIDAIHKTADGRRLLVLHGDEFDNIVKHNSWLAYLGSGAYDTLLLLNRWYNVVRRKFGLSYWSLSAYLKHRVKNAVNFISGFEQALAWEAGRRRVDGIVCGHIHKASIDDSHGVVYANSGDWVESCTALVEDDSGCLRALRWAEESFLLLDKIHENRDRDRRLAPTD